jgi:hypothetical protein
MYAWTFAATIVAGIVAYLLFSGFLKTYRLYRGMRIITCPENHQSAAVRVAAWDAAKCLTAAWRPIGVIRRVIPRVCSGGARKHVPAAPPAQVPRSRSG